MPTGTDVSTHVGHMSYITGMLHTNNTVAGLYRTSIFKSCRNRNWNRIL